jgi:hypothetical protein
MGTLADLAESGDADALSAAIADGAHLDEADDEGNTATHKAAQGEPECLRLLLSHGATVDSANAEGSTPLIEAVKYGDRECVAIILEAGAAMAHLDATGRSALGYAEDEVADAEIISMLGGTARAEPVEERKPANTGRRCSVSSESVDPSQKVDLSQIPRQEKDEAGAARVGSGRGGDAADAAACAAAFEGWRADGALSPADGDDALPPRVRAGKDERRGQLAVRRYPPTHPPARKSEQ